MGDAVNGRHNRVPAVAFSRVRLEHEAAGDVYALLLALREGGRRQRPEPFKDRLRSRLCFVYRNTNGVGRIADDVDGNLTRDGKYELADIADRAAPHLDHFPGNGADQVDRFTAVLHDDLSGISRLLHL